MFSPMLRNKPVCVCVYWGWRVSANWTASQAADMGWDIPAWTCGVSPAAIVGSTSDWCPSALPHPDKAKANEDPF